MAGPCSLGTSRPGFSEELEKRIGSFRVAEADRQEPHRRLFIRRGLLGEFEIARIREAAEKPRRWCPVKLD